MLLMRRLFVDVATTSRLDLDPEAFRRVEERIDEAARSDRRLIMIIVAGVLLSLLVGYSIGKGVMWVVDEIGIAKGIGIAIVATVNPIVLLAAWFTVFPMTMRRLIRRTLRESGYDICVRCGYLLDGLPSSATRCPECGRAEQPPLGEASREN